MEDQPMDAEDDYSNEQPDADMIINESDGLPNVHPNLANLEREVTKQKDCDAVEGARTIDELIHDDDLPTSLIVTNVDSSVYQNDEAKNQIQILFSQFGAPESIQFLKSFKRMRVNYAHPAVAAKTRIHLHQTFFGGKRLNCYFAQPVSPIDLEDMYLKAPAPTKQFLISPPSSPPVGWEPREEGEPLVNYDLLAAIANLTPGEAHEIHAPSESHPGIVVHVCEEATGTSGVRISHTRCPQHN